tara:strand:- start:1358 stop:1981 length:624 start_codon:yes stop_codon:yes gene_type:complete
MQNYIIEDNINFYNELNKNDNDDYSNKDICLLSHLPLSDNFITLPCNHKFNYLDLYNEIFNLKHAGFKYKYCQNLSSETIKCPYCRKKFNLSLPFIPLYNLPPNKLIFSNKNKLSLYNCTYKNKSGKNKDKSCNNCCAFKSHLGTYCNKHYNQEDKKYKINEERKSLLLNPRFKLLNKKTKSDLETICREKGIIFKGNKFEIIKKLL